MNCRSCGVHFCWECGQFAWTTDYHKQRCQSYSWYASLPFPVDGNEKLLHYAHASEATGQHVSTVSTALFSSDNISASALGYAPASLLSVWKAEHVLLEAQRLLVRVALARYTGGACPVTIHDEQAVTDFAVRLHANLRFNRLCPKRRTVGSRFYHSTADQLHSLLACWQIKMD